jgi:hypothetical protein
MSKNTTAPTAKPVASCSARKVSHNFSHAAETVIAAILSMQAEVIDPLISDPETPSEDRGILVRLYDKMSDSLDALHDEYPLQVV